MTRALKQGLMRAPEPIRGAGARTALRGYEWYLARRGNAAGGAGVAEPADAGGWPLPPPSLRVAVAWTADPRFFLESGRSQAAFIRELARRNGLPPERMSAVLDFGCGCGRLARWWSDLDQVELHGSDRNPELVEWCSRNLPFMTAAVNDLEPRLAYEDESFDLVYALSVFTHLTEELQRGWLAELVRVLRPGGLLFFTVGGAHYLERLSARDREAFEAGELVTEFDEVAGTNLCAAYHPPRYVTERMLTGLELVEAVRPGDGYPAGLVQDSYLARKP